MKGPKKEPKVEERVNVTRGIIFLAVLFAIAGLASVEFMRWRVKEPIVDGPGVTEIKHLSDYLPNLKGNVVDSEVYFLDSKAPGATILIYNAHPCEPGALVEQILLIERAVPKAGRLIVIPRAVQTGYEDLEPGRGYPARFHIQQNGGERWFRMGGRMTALRRQWPLPMVFQHYPSGQKLADVEVTNLNRCLPGRPDGYLTERIAYAIVEIVRQEKVDMVIDNHEAPPDRPLVEALCVHPRALDLGAEAVLNMEILHGIQWRLEVSPANLRGLSHREIGGVTDAYVFLHETASPLHGPLRGAATEELLLSGYDEFELRAAKMGRVFCSYDESGKPIEQRVGYKLAFLEALSEAWNVQFPDRPLVIENLPQYEQIVELGIGPFLAPAPAPEPPLKLVSKYLF